MELLEELVRQRLERGSGCTGVSLENVDAKEGEDTMTCDYSEARFGRDYVRKLCNFTEDQVTEIEYVCSDTLKPTGPGKRYSDMGCRLIVHLTWLTSGWTVPKLSALFRLPRAAIQRTLTYVMSGLTESLKAAYLPRSSEELEVMKPRHKSKFFPYVLGAVDATLIPIRKPTGEAVNNANFPENTIVTA